MSSISTLTRENRRLAHRPDGLVSVLVPTGYRNPLSFGCAQRARERIDASGLLRQDVAAMAGVSRAAVIYMEDGKSVPRLSTVERVGDALGVSPTWIAYGEEGTIRFRHRRVPSPVPFDPPPTNPGHRPHRDAWRKVALRLAEARKKMGFTLRDVGDAARVSAQTILLIEKGESDPMISTVEQLAIALDVAPGWLAFGEGDGPQTSDSV